MTKPDLVDHVETIQLAISQVANPELRDDASKALTALLKGALEQKVAREMAATMERELFKGDPAFLDTFKAVGEKRGRFKYDDGPPVQPNWAWEKER
jgi:hypothetical protein